ncbi:MAG: hypothetical protein ABH824_07365 [Nanoarchaeota archaeon]|nr:hypothetical protein [Nanoarchaeota archaeon]MBU1632009.1 hypothetical protein [Nanoarchaeota archaeon]MBU1875624.1 hypothetical protein [Nanoarchaeota archaeon]
MEYKMSNNRSDFQERIFVGVTCTSSRRKKEHWEEQLREINELNINQIAIFPTILNHKQRQKLYEALENSSVKEIKLVHLREDFTKKELDYFYNKFNTRLFNCHEREFDAIYRNFPQYRKNIVLELNYDNKIENKIEPNKSAGFCIDFAHMKVAKDRHTCEYDYILKRLKNTHFQANHLNGYSKRKKEDLHFVTNKNQFDYLKELPKEIFGKVIGLELENSIKKQLEFKKYLVKILNRKFKN